MLEPMDQPHAHAALGPEPIRTIGREELKAKLDRGEDSGQAVLCGRPTRQDPHPSGYSGMQLGLAARERRTASRLLAPLIARRHSSQCCWTGDVRSTTWRHRAHTMSATCNHSRDRAGWGSGTSFAEEPSQFYYTPSSGPA